MSEEPAHIILVKETEICKNCKNIVVGKGNLNADDTVYLT